MNDLSATQLASDTFRLVQRFGAGLYLDFLALAVAATTLTSLLSPQSLRSLTRGEADPGPLALITDPAVLAEEAIFTIFFAMGCLRIWRASGQSVPGAGEALRQMAVPLVVLSIATGLLAYIGMLILLVPGLLVLALTTTLVPMIVIEGRSWTALRPTLRQCQPALGVLTLAWGLAVLPLILIAILLSPAPALAEAPITTLWLAWLVPDLLSAVISVVSVCLTMATYLHLSPMGGAELEDIFR